jgi:hypothetical protein
MLPKSIILVLLLLSFVTYSVSAQTAKIPADLVITMERTVCYGTCPDYKLTIKANGSVMFRGGRFTKTKGTAKSRISKALLRELIAEFDRVDLNSFTDDYSQGDVCESYITDLPSQIISIKRNGKTKQVNHYFGCTGKAVQEKLEPLTELGKMIDRITNSKRWVGRK